MTVEIKQCDRNMSWIDIAVTRKGIVVADFSEGWSDHITEFYWEDVFETDPPKHLTVGMYRWSGYEFGFWDEYINLKGGVFEQRQPYGDVAKMRDALKQIRQLEPETLWSIPDRDTGERPSFETLDAGQVFSLIDEALSTLPEPRPYLAYRFEWPAPGDQQEDAWILRFCDNDVRDMIWTGPEAEAEAWAAWNRHAPGYNCYLFRLATMQEQRQEAAGEGGRDMFESGYLACYAEQVAHSMRGQAFTLDDAMVDRAWDIYLSTRETSGDEG